MKTANKRQSNIILIYQGVQCCTKFATSILYYGTVRVVIQPESSGWSNMKNINGKGNLAVSNFEHIQSLKRLAQSVNV